MNVRTKLLGAFTIYIALLAALSLYHVRTIRRAVTSGKDVTKIAERLRVTSTVQPGRLKDVSTYAEKFIVTRDTGYLARLRQTMRDYDDELRRLDTLQELSSRERALLSPLKADWEHAQEVAAQLGTKKLDASWMDQFQPALDRVSDGTGALAAASQDAMGEELTASARSETEAQQATLYAAGGALLLSLILSALVGRSILEPMKKLAEGTREVSAGRFSHRIPAKGKDELAQLGRDFNAMTERLDELDRMKREFVSKVSHDLKTPLSSMQETTGVMLDEVPGPLTPKQRQLLEINHESGRRLHSMLSKLLDLSRIEAGLEPKRQVIDVRAVVQRSVNIADASNNGRVTLTMTDPSPRLNVRGDPDSLAQVFDNLLDNALKFSPVDGQVAVRVSDLAARGVLVTFTDQGPGIPDAEKERVFERFYQADAGRAVRSRGVGLGLAICREIVTAHGGAIWVTDNEPRGSVFHVMLPGATRASGDSPAISMMAQKAKRA